MLFLVNKRSWGDFSPSVSLSLSFCKCPCLEEGTLLTPRVWSFAATSFPTAFSQEVRAKSMGPGTCSVFLLRKRPHFVMVRLGQALSPVVCPSTNWSLMSRWRGDPKGLGHGPGMAQAQPGRRRFYPERLSALRPRGRLPSSTLAFGLEKNMFSCVILLGLLRLRPGHCGHLSGRWPSTSILWSVYRGFTNALS